MSATADAKRQIFSRLAERPTAFSSKLAAVLEKDSLLTCSELAAIVARSERTIQRYVSQKKIESVITLDGIRIPRSEVGKFQSGVNRRHVVDTWRQDLNDSRQNVDGLRQESTVDAAPVDRDRQASPEDDSGRRQGATIPIEVHSEALKGLQEALRMIEERNQVAEHMRLRAEQAERQKLAIEAELHRYRLALSEQAESLAEERARVMVAQAQLETHLDKLKCDTPKPSFGQKVKGWLFGSRQAAG
jgi:hypothetical protein